MVIRKMNSVFQKHGRWLFAIITLFIIVSFVGFLTPGFTSLFLKNNADKAVGVVFGEPLSYDEYNEQIDRGAIALSMQFGGGNPASSYFRQMAQYRAFETITWNKAAWKRGIRISDQEVADYMRKLPLFKGASGFDPQKYETYVEKTLKPSGYDKQDMDEAIRQSLAVTELVKQITGDVIVTPNEVRDYFEGIQEKIDAEVAYFKGKSCEGQVKLDEKEIKAYFENEKSKYMTSPRYQAEVVRFNYINYEKQAAARITKEQMEKYYEANKSSYTAKGKGKDKGKILPFDKVKAKIKDALLKAAEKDLALRDADNFANEAYKKFEEAVEEGKDGQDVFQQLAAESKIKTYATGWLKDSDKKIKGIGLETQLIKAISKIYIKIPVAAVAGKRAAFAAFLTGIEEPRPRKLAEVRKEIEKNIRSLKAINLAREKARAAALEASQANDPKKKLDELNIKLEKIDTFIPMYKDRMSIKNGKIIANLAMNTPVGKTSPAESVSDGALLVYVSQRTLPSEDDFSKQKAIIAMRYKQEKQRAALEAFGAWVNTQCKTFLKGN